jgi:hypothetical protein
LGRAPAGAQPAGSQATAGPEVRTLPQELGRTTGAKFDPERVLREVVVMAAFWVVVAAVGECL